MTPVWVDEQVVLALHEEQLAEHGGAPGIRDLGLLQSALARPQNLFAYQQADIAALGAAYGFSLAKNHPFIDGNKRVSFAVTALFLLLNGFEIAAPGEQSVQLWLSLATGEADESSLAEWIRRNVVKSGWRGQ